MKKAALIAALLASFGTSGCAALLGASAGAAAVACTADDVNCPPTQAAQEVDQAL
ncbi:hypothetical protein [Altericroceibacterium xinjiangense]|uniref:hypothetical protein n=1 Tax=Altericroceibacterium xinjiangense TaxID=762261 RepID=UPI0013DF2D89|nr:hypothetical protein [Altericroceibacterium xinjiangense]